MRKPMCNITNYFQNISFVSYPRGRTSIPLDEMSGGTGWEEPASVGQCGISNLVRLGGGKSTHIGEVYSLRLFEA